MKSLTTKGCLNKITKDYIPVYGAPKAILSDNASIFASKRWKEPLEDKGIKVYHCSAYHPASNPSDRGLRDVTTYLRVLCYKNHRTWFNALPLIQCIMNRTPNPTTKITLHELMTGDKPPPLCHGIPPHISPPGQDELDAKLIAFKR